jgi:hypothetical protein
MIIEAELREIIESAEVTQKLADGLALVEFECRTTSCRRACVQVGTSGAGAPPSWIMHMRQTSFQHFGARTNLSLLLVY